MLIDDPWHPATLRFAHELVRQARYGELSRRRADRLARAGSPTRWRRPARAPPRSPGTGSRAAVDEALPAYRRTGLRRRRRGRGPRPGPRRGGPLVRPRAGTAPDDPDLLPGPRRRGLPGRSTRRGARRLRGRARRRRAAARRRTRRPRRPWWSAASPARCAPALIAALRTGPGAARRRGRRRARPGAGAVRVPARGRAATGAAPSDQPARRWRWPSAPARPAALVAAIHARHEVLDPVETPRRGAGAGRPQLRAGPRSGRPDAELWGRGWRLDALLMTGDLAGFDAEMQRLGRAGRPAGLAGRPLAPAARPGRPGAAGRPVRRGGGVRRGGAATSAYARRTSTAVWLYLALAGGLARAHRDFRHWTGRAARARAHGSRRADRGGPDRPPRDG